MNQPNIEKFSCKICLEVAQEPVITPCGHLYCWACIYQWKNTKPDGNLLCPFCSNFIDITKLTPIYTTEEPKKDTTKEIPKRPQPERANPPPPQNNSNPNGNFSFNIFGFPFLFGGFGFSFGNNGLNVGRNHNVRGISPNVYIVLGIIALNLILNFGPLILGFGEHEYQHERREFSKSKKVPKSSNSGGSYKNSLMEDDFGLFFATMVFFIGIALLWKFLKKRN